MDKKTRLSVSTKKLLSQLILTPLHCIQYTTYDSLTQAYSGWKEVFCDGYKIYDKQQMVPFANTRDPFDRNYFLSPLADYILAQNSRQTIYDWRNKNTITSPKPILNPNHPWVKEFKNGRRF
jgi:hypothetical protein